MWPSDDAIKQTLSGTSELIFDTAGCLKLNNTIGWAGYLNKELIKSAIHSLNITFEQEKKLILANQLRNYIDSAHHQALLKSEKISLWKNFIKSLPSLEFLRLSAYSLIIIIPCLFIWPIYVGSLLVIGLLSYPLSTWLIQKINYRRAQTITTKNTTQLITFMDTLNQADHPKNPLFITRESKLFKECTPQELPNFPSLSIEDLAIKLTHISNKPYVLKELIRHMGSKSTYPQKDSLKRALELVYYRLNGDFDTKLGPVSEKALIIDKLLQGMTQCTAGFHIRINTILEAFQQPQTLNELLYGIRKNLVEKTTIILMNKANIDLLYEIHAVNDITKVAYAYGLGIQPNSPHDAYSSELKKQVIRLALQSEFENSYTLFNLPDLLIDALRGLLLELGYTGPKEKTESYTIGCVDAEVDKLTELIKKYLPTPEFQKLDWAHFFIIDEENDHILDLDWKLISQYFFDCLLKDNYFTIPYFDDFSKNLTHLLSSQNKQAFNYLMLLAQYQPESLKLLFYYLKRCPSSETEKIKEQLIHLFFKKNQHSQNVVQLAAQYHPKALNVLLDFINEHIDQFDLEITDFLHIDNYHIDSLKIILDFTEKHLTLSDKQTISAFFLKKNDAYWNSFVKSTQNQPKIALNILSYIIEHPEMFNSKTVTNQSLFKENLAKLQQGLSNLLVIEKPNMKTTHILLKFISLYPELLAHTPKKVAHFILSSLSNMNDKKLIDTIIDSHTHLLLNYFSINYFRKHIKNTEYILGRLLCVYQAELQFRARHHMIYNNFFKLGFSVHEKLKGLQALLVYLENSPDCEKKEPLNSLKTVYPVLANGRLGQFFKLCCHNDTELQQIKVELGHLKSVHSF